MPSRKRRARRSWRTPWPRHSWTRLFRSRFENCATSSSKFLSFSLCYFFVCAGCFQKGFGGEFLARRREVAAAAQAGQEKGQAEEEGGGQARDFLCQLVFINLVHSFLSLFDCRQRRKYEKAVERGDVGDNKNNSAVNFVMRSPTLQLWYSLARARTPGKRNDISSELNSRANHISTVYYYEVNTWRFNNAWRNNFEYTWAYFCTR